MASFYVIRGADNGQHFSIRGEVTQIGRGQGSPIQLNDTEVSRQHAVIYRTSDGEHEIADNNSSNGTYINSRRITREKLHSGDRVQVGRTLLIYTSGPEPNDSNPLLHSVGNPASSHDVEIIVGEEAQPLAQITQSLESHCVSHAELSLGHAPGKTSMNVSANHQDPPQDEAESWLSENWRDDEGGIVYKVSQAVRRTLDLNDLLEQVLMLIFQWIACDRGCIMLVDAITGQLTPTISRDSKTRRVGSKNRNHQPIRISRTILDHVIAFRRGVMTSNAQDDSRWQGVESIANLGVHEAICVPMLGRYGLVGAIYVDTQISAGAFADRKGKKSLEEKHLRLMLTIAGQAALAIEDTQFYQAMMQSERLAAMGKTIANLSHHVKNILQGVRGGSYLVEDGIKKEKLDVIERGWKIVQRNQDRIANLVLDMLSFSKEREPTFQVGDISALVKEIVDLMSERAKEANVVLKMQPVSNLGDIEFDGESMHHAVLNVVTNAIDAAAATPESEKQGQVRIAIQSDSEKSSVSIHVEDNGEGIQAEDLQTIFTPFESSKGARGTGLGLPVSQKILREHGGDITVQSEVGMGTTMILQWPARRFPAASQTIESPLLESPNQGNV
ncbi:MAG: FHA domain-containing protein [Planctomycetales bacterium]|nr:FHA domain-containing protein [Planctomycetales bacterium]